MKKTCNSCKALDETSGYCMLGYKSEKIHHPTYIELIINHKPLEECPKPKTIDKFIELHMNSLI